MTPRRFLIAVALAALVFVVVLLAPRDEALPLRCEAPSVKFCPPPTFVPMLMGETWHMVPVYQPCRCEVRS